MEESDDDWFSVDTRRAARKRLGMLAFVILSLPVGPV